MKMSDPVIWLGRFLDRRGLKASDGRHLWAYRTQAEEFAELRQLVERYVRRTRFPRERAEAACFCLYAAEWLRRELQATQWNQWQPIFRSLGVDRPSHETCATAVEQGFSYWRLRILRGNQGTRYFTSLVCEGGLPLQLLQAGGSERLRHYFRALLDDAAVFGDEPEILRSAAERFQELLPTGWRTDAVFELSVELIRTVRDLQCRVRGADQPIRMLDEVYPAWRDELPIEVGDFAVGELVANLVDYAAQVAARPRRSIRVIRVLSEVAEGAFEVSRRLVLPSWIEKEAFEEPFREAGDPPLPERSTLVVESPDGEEAIQVAEATRVSDTNRGEGYLLEGDELVELPRRFVDVAVLLVARGAGRHIGPVQLPGGSGASPLPWTFVEREGRWESVGEGSTSTSRPEVRIAVAPDCAVEVVEGRLEKLGSTTDGRRVYQLRGVALVWAGDREWRCRIRTGASELEDIGVRFVGPRAWAAYAPDAFLGRPRLLGLARESELQWRPRGQKQWRSWDLACVGDVEVRLEAEGDLLFQDSIRVLPRESRVELRPAGNDEGSIFLCGLGTDRVGAAELEGVEKQILRNHNGTEIRLRSRGEPPSRVDLVVEWPEGQYLTLRLPFPIVGGRFIDHAGRVIEDRKRVDIERIGGIVAQGFRAGMGAGFAIDVKLRGRGESQLTTRTNHLYRLFDEKGVATLPLAAIQDSLELALAMSKDLDATLQLRLETTVGRAQSRVLEVGRYDRRFNIDSQNRRIELAGSHAEAGERFRAELVSLLDPGADPIPLEESCPGVWRLPDSISPGPWLVLGWEGQRCLVRPTLWQQPGQLELEPGSLRAAIVQPSERARLEAIDAAICRLVDAPSHEDWKLVDDYLRLAEHVPPTSFDLLDRLIEVPEAAVIALLRAEMTGPGFGKVWRILERLPFSWHLVPTTAWIRALQTWWQESMHSLEGVGEETRADALAHLSEWVLKWGSLVQGRIMGISQVFERANLGLVFHTGPTLGETALLELRRSDMAKIDRNRHFPTNADPRENLSEAAGERQLPEDLWLQAPPGAGFMRAVLDAPVAAALASVYGIRLRTPSIYDIRRLQAFDPEWFDRAYGYTFAIAFARLRG